MLKGDYRKLWRDQTRKVSTNGKRRRVVTPSMMEREAIERVSKNTRPTPNSTRIIRGPNHILVKTENGMI